MAHEEAYVGCTSYLPSTIAGPNAPGKDAPPLCGPPSRGRPFEACYWVPTLWSLDCLYGQPSRGCHRLPWPVVDPNPDADSGAVHTSSRPKIKSLWTGCATGQQCRWIISSWGDPSGFSPPRVFLRWTDLADMKNYNRVVQSNRPPTPLEAAAANDVMFTDETVINIHIFLPQHLIQLGMHTTRLVSGDYCFESWNVLTMQLRKESVGISAFVVTSAHVEVKTHEKHHVTLKVTFESDKNICVEVLWLSGSGGEDACNSYRESTKIFESSNVCTRCNTCTRCNRIVCPNEAQKVGDESKRHLEPCRHTLHSLPLRNLPTRRMIPIRDGAKCSRVQMWISEKKFVQIRNVLKTARLGDGLARAVNIFMALYYCGAQGVILARSSITHLSPHTPAHMKVKNTFPTDLDQHLVASPSSVPFPTLPGPTLDDLLTQRSLTDAMSMGKATVTYPSILNLTCPPLVALEGTESWRKRKKRRAVADPP
ncbi:hypothetical protein EI94DRAFT_1710545 [Lactarius quietus]|nr:hypothetical protein EI94DRAFT_1710545 [Lactarius quietus]